MFTEVDKNLLFSKNDPQDPRLGELVKTTNFNTASNSVHLLAYPDDEGIKNNGGRIGAAEGPNEIRNFLYRMTPPLNSQIDNLELYDLGDVQLNLSIEERHEVAKNQCLESLRLKNQWIGIGGGHDYAYPDGWGFITHCLENNIRPLIINIDAHLDVRPMNNGISSGTPFYRLLTEFEGKFDFYEIGIQNQCNSKQHYDWAKSKGAEVISWEEMEQSYENKAQFIFDRLGEHILKRSHCFLSVDLDGFSSAFAPACSQAWPTGFLPEEFFQFFHGIHRSLQIDCLGVYECSPRYDSDHRTARLASQIIHRYLYKY